MAKNAQLSLKPQDVVVLFNLKLATEQHFTYAGLAHVLLISVSESHAAVSRLQAARLVYFEDSRPIVSAAAFEEFILHGAKFSFPPISGGIGVGLVTSYAAEPLASVISQSDELPPIWPTSSGETLGTILHPLYPSVPNAALNDPRLYEVLSLFDALRGGAARERDIAKGMLRERFS